MITSVSSWFAGSLLRINSRAASDMRRGDRASEAKLMRAGIKDGLVQTLDFTCAELSVQMSKLLANLIYIRHRYSPTFELGVVSKYHVFLLIWIDWLTCLESNICVWKERWFDLIQNTCLLSECFLTMIYKCFLV